MIAPARVAAYEILESVTSGRADLPAAQHQRLPGQEMFGRDVLQQRHYVVHVNLSVHRFKL